MVNRSVLVVDKIIINISITVYKHVHWDILNINSLNHVNYVHKIVSIVIIFILIIVLNANLIYYHQTVNVNKNVQ
jgi:hypothetical protein